MSTIREEIISIAKDAGFTGDAATVKDAVLALADTLAGEDAGDAASIAEAIGVLAPYIGGGGGAEIGALVDCYTPMDSPMTPGETYAYQGIYSVSEIAIGDASVSVLADATLNSVAVGSTVTHVAPVIENTIKFWVGEVSSNIVTSAQEASITPEIITEQDAPVGFRYTVPTVPEGKVLFVKYSTYD